VKTGVDNGAKVVYTLENHENVIEQFFVEVIVLTIGQRLTILRGDKSQAEVAKAVGVATSTIGMYEQDARIPRDEIKKRLAVYYKTTVGQLFFAEENHES